MKIKNRFSSLCYSSLVASLLLAASSHAATLYWDVNGTATGFSTVIGGWNGTNAFWNDQATGTGGTPVAITTIADDLNIVAATTNTGTITVSGAQVARSITYSSTVGAVTISGGTSLTLGDGTTGGITLNSGAAAQAISTPLILNGSQTWTNNSANALTWSGGLNLGTGTLTFEGSGNFQTTTGAFAATAGSVIHNGTGLVIFRNTNSYTGSTTISGGGILMIDDSRPTGNFNITSGILTDYFQTTNTFTGGLGTGNNQIQITGNSGFGGGNGTSTWRIGSAGSSLVWGASGEGTASGFFNPTTLRFFAVGADNLGPTAYGAIALDNGINLNGASRTISVAPATGSTPLNSSATISGVISATGGGSITLTGGGHLVLSNTGNSYSGSTTITSGTLSAAATGSLGNGSATNTLNFNGGTLRATGTITSPSTREVTMTSTGIIDNNGQAISIAGNISGAGGMTKNGAGTLTLSGTNSYGGVTTVNAGTLVITRESALASNTAANLNVKSGATLQLNVDSAGTSGFASASLSTLLANISVANTAAEGLQAGAILAIDTSTATAGTFTLSSAITNSTGAFGGQVNLVKLGAGTLVLDQMNTNTGPTIVTAGSIQYNDGGALSSRPLMLNGGSFALNRSSTATQGTEIPTIIGGTGGLSNIGSGTLVLNAPTFHTGNTAATVGNITLAHPRAIQFSALDTTGAGNFSFSGTGSSTPIIGGLANSGTTRNLASVIDSSYGSVTNLTLNPQSGSSFTYSGVIADGATGMSVTKTGAGTQILTGTNTYTGTTFLNQGTLAVGTGSTIGRITGSTALTFNGGTLQFNRSGTIDVDAFNNTAPITVNASSTFGTTSQDAGNANANETLGAVTLNAGQMNFNATNSPSSGSIMILSGLTRNGSASANFNGLHTGAGFRWQVSGQSATAAGQIISPAYTTGGNNVGFASTDYAVYLASGFISPANIAASGESTWTSAANAYTLNNAAGSTANGRLSDTRDITALRNTTTPTNTNNTGAPSGFTNGINTATEYLHLPGNTFADGDVVNATGTGGLNTIIPYYVIDAGGAGAGTFRLSATPGGSAVDLTNTTAGAIAGGLTLSSGKNLGTFGILNGSTTAMAIGASGTGAVTLPTTSSGNLFITTGAGAINIGAPINDNTATGILTLVKNGAGTLTLSSSTSNFTGGIVLNAGTLSFTNNSALNDNNITVNGAARLEVPGGSANQTVGGGVTLNSGSVLTFGANGGSITINGAVTGDGALVSDRVSSSGSTNVLASTGNTFTGTISFTAGATMTLRFNSLADSPSLGAGNIRFAAPSSAQTFALDTGAIAPVTLNNRQIEFVTAPNTTAIIANNSSQAFTINTDLVVTATTGTRTLELSGSGSGASSFNGKLENGALTSLSLSKTASGTWTVSGNNNYSGTTSVSAGTLVMSGSNSLTGAITVSGASGATLTLSGNNSATTSPVTLSTSTGTVASSPRLNINNATALGSGTLTLGGGLASDVVRIDNTSAGAVNVSTANPIALNRNFTFVGTQSLNLGTGPVSIGGITTPGARTIVVSGNTLTFGGTITEAAAGTGMTRQGPGTLTLSSANNSFSGSVTLTGGNTNITKLADSGSNSSLGTGSSSAPIRMNGGTLNYTGTGGDSTNRAIEMVAGAAINNNGTGTIAFTAGNVSQTGTASARTLTLGGSYAGGANTFASILGNSGTGANITSLVKNGNSTWVLSGDSTYTGTTTVNEGTLAVTGSLGATAVSVAAGTLAGNGDIGGSVSIAAGATHSLAVASSPGAQITREIAGTLTLTSGNILNLTAASTPSNGDYVLATATTITGTPTTINYNGINGTVTVDTESSPQRLLLSVSGDDMTPPGLTSITDSVSGGPVDIGATITYTVTFSEDIDAATVSAADFNNNGTAAITVGAITETSPGVFTVVVTADSPGSLKLRIPTGAVIKDVAGNDLVVPVEDDTTITVRTIFESWANVNGATGGKTGDPDGDGFINLMEFAFDTNPTTNSAASIAYSGGVVTAHGQPILEEDGGIYYAVFGRRVNYVAAGLTYTVQFSAGLDQWTSSVTVPSTVATDGVIDAVRVPFPNTVPTPSGPKKPTFFRVVISD
jgi:fibronectin-binding autotransporter adhesin